MKLCVFLTTKREYKSFSVGAHILTEYESVDSEDGFTR